MGDAVLQVLLNGLIAGMAIGVLALAFTVVSLPTRVFHIALGGIYGLAPFIAWQALRWEMPWYVAIGTALLVALLVSLGCEKANHGPLARRGASVSAQLVSLLGIHILLVQTAALGPGGEKAQHAFVFRKQPFQTAAGNDSQVYLHHHSYVSRFASKMQARIASPATRSIRLQPVV